MKRLLPFSLVAIAAIILSACGSAAAPELRSGESSELAPAAPMPTMMDMGYAPQEMPAQPPGSGGGGVLAASAERMIIENAEIAIVVPDVEARMAELQEMARGMGGFVVSSNIYKTYRNNVEAPEGTLVIRVPSANLNDALANIKAGAVEVQNESRSGQDVTSQYVDLESRLKNLEAAEAQLNQIMKTATETEDVVNIFNQLVYYREQIELVKGQMKYLEESAALSAITIRLIAEETIQPIQIGRWQPQGVALKAIEDLISFWQGFINFLIRFIIYTLPVWISIGIPLYLAFIGIRALFRKLRGSRAKVEEKAVEKKAEKK